jgi:hypothetical protein
MSKAFFEGHRYVRGYMTERDNHRPHGDPERGRMRYALYETIDGRVKRVGTTLSEAAANRFNHRTDTDEDRLAATARRRSARTNGGNS